MIGFNKETTINITMIGASGVGKTTLLTSMYNEFNRDFSYGNHLKLTADEDTQMKLDKKLSMLVSQINDDDIVMTPQLEGTDKVEEFKFVLSRHIKSKERLNLLFRDFPGGYLKTQRNKVREIIEKSQIILIPIDTSALMEEQSRFNELVNNTNSILEMYQDLTSLFERRERLIIFVPLKSEKSLYAKENIFEIFEKKYQGILDFFDGDTVRKKNSVIFTPIKTLGSIFFSKIDDSNKQIPKFVYKARVANPQYLPENCDQPLRYIVSFALKQDMQNKSFWNRFNSKKIDNETLETSFKKYLDSCRRDEQFKILLNRDLLLN
ncbi:MAG: hypothetical protein U9Q30_00835 [Campylobacterota bacterium]|nr:hypothetical protein [Campylobacterota bacterium]